MLTKIFSLAYHHLRDWLLQRITAAVMALYSLLWLGLVAVKPLGTHAAWQQLFACGWMKAASLLFVLSLLYHAWLGVRDISMDYIPVLVWRKVFQVAVVLALLFYAGWSLVILWSV